MACAFLAACAVKPASRLLPGYLSCFSNFHACSFANFCLSSGVISSMGLVLILLNSSLISCLAFSSAASVIVVPSGSVISTIVKPPLVL